MPELLGPITDLGVIQRHRKLVEVVMAGIFAPAFFEQEFSAVLIPFQLQSFYATPPFERHLRAEDGYPARPGEPRCAEMMSAMRLFFAYALVLDRIYGIHLIVDYPLVLTVPDPDTGSSATSRWISTGGSSRSETVGDVPPLPTTSGGGCAATCSIRTCCGTSCRRTGSCSAASPSSGPSR